MNSHTDVAQAELLNVYLAHQYRRSYRYGICLLMIGALMNWIGFAQTYLLPIRYIGVAFVMAGTICVGAATCKWTKTPAIIQEPSTPEPSPSVVPLPSKPPEYSTVAPPSYEEAILLNPAGLISNGKSQDNDTVRPQWPQESNSSTSRDCVLNIDGETSESAKGNGEKSEQMALGFEDNFLEHQSVRESGEVPKLVAQQ